MKPDALAWISRLLRVSAISDRGQGAQSAAISENESKNDRQDAEMLRVWVLQSAFVEAHSASQRGAATRSKLIRAATLVRARTMLIIRRAVVKSAGGRLPRFVGELCARVSAAVPAELGRRPSVIAPDRR